MAPHPTQILLVEDDRALRDLVSDELADAGWQVRTAVSAEEAWPIIAGEAVELVISDLRLPGADGLMLLDWLDGLTNPPALIVITAFGTIDQAVDAIKRGADDFLTKPIDFEHLLVRVERVLENRRLRQRIRQLENLVGTDSFHGLVGRSEPMRTLFDMIARIGAADGPALVLGESGTGKELVARAIHAESPRAQEPFVTVNCAGVPAELLESEFFGHMRGAFTGASHARTGLLQQAHGGSLFLDEIGEMPAALQAKLLRVLEDGVVRPVGADLGQTVDVRVIAATNRDLRAAIDSGAFREDFYYRLETFQLRVPTLRERADDIELLAMRFLKHFAERLGRDAVTLDPLALQALRAYSFPGNIRELSNLMERAAAFSQGDAVTEADLPDYVRSRTASPATGSAETVGGEDLASLAAMENRYIRYVLQRCDGNKRRAAEILGIGRRTLYRKLELDEAGEAADSDDDSG
jgi:DNA-binding NtrC family response regulator